MAYPYSETTWSNGVTAVSAANMNNIEDGITAARSFVGCKLFLDSDQTVANGSYASIVWTDEHFDPQGFWSSGATITIPSDHGGYYQVLTQVRWIAGNTGSSELWIRKNSSLLDSSNASLVSGGNASAHTLQASGIMALAVGDTVDVQVRQDTGVSRDIDGGSSGLSTWVALTYLGY